MDPQVQQYVLQRLGQAGRFRIGATGASGPDDLRLEISTGAPNVTALPRYRPAPIRRRGGPCASLESSYVIDGIDYHASVPVEVRLIQSSTGRMLGSRTIVGTATGFEFVQTGFYGGFGGFAGTSGFQSQNTADRAMQDALEDRKSGVIRTILDWVPVRGSILSGAPGEPPHVTLDVGSSQGVRENDRFLVFDSGSGLAKAVLRAREITPTTTLASVHYRDQDDKNVLPARGDQVLTQGY